MDCKIFFKMLYFVMYMFSVFILTNSAGPDQMAFYQGRHCFQSTLQG